MGCYATYNTVFKPKAPVTEEQVQALLAEFGEPDTAGGVHADGDVWFNAGGGMSHCGWGEMQIAFDAFIEDHAADFAIVTGEYEGEFYEELVCPPHVDKKDARVRWALRKVATLLKGEAPDFLAALRKVAELADAFALDWVMHEGADDPDAEAAAQQVAVVQRFLRGIK